MNRLLTRARICLHAHRDRWRVWSTRRNAYVISCGPCRRRWAARTETGASGCLVLIIVALVFLLGSCVNWAIQTDRANNQWCNDVESFWADGNQYDTGLDDEYAMQC